MRHVDTNERRSRLARRHRLANPASDPIEATRAMVCLHSSDPASVYLSVRARVPGFSPTDLEDLLYEDRSLVRMYGMRRTLWVVEREMVAIIHNSSTRAVGEKDRRRSIKILEDGGITDDGAVWLEKMEPKTLSVIAEQGEILTRDLTRAIPELDARIEFRNKSGKLMGTTGLSSRVLNQLALESRVVRTRPTGTWISGQYHYAEMEDWLGGPIEEIPVAEASAYLIRRWLYSFGPATETDMRWWTGWPVKQVRQALADIAAVEVRLDENSAGYLLPDDLDPVDQAAPWVAILPSLDPTTMGWKEREWYMGEHEPLLFDSVGNGGPTIWVDGRVVGGWAKRKDGQLVHEVLVDVGAETTSVIEDQLQDLETWFGGVSVTPRFRSLHDRRLAP